MEQSTGPVIPPMHTAGTDPANVPGLTFPSPAGTEGAGPEEAPESSTAHDAPDGETAPGTDRAPGPGATGAEAEPGAGPATDSGTATADDAAEQAEDQAEGRPAEPAEDAGAPAEGPSFEAADRRASVTVDHTGVRFRLDEEEAAFGWDEVGAVEVSTPRFGRRFHVTVYLSPHRWYEADVDAPDRARLKAWTAELDTVLDAYFEDSDAGDPDSSAPSDAADDTAGATAKPEKADGTEVAGGTEKTEVTGGTGKTEVAGGPEAAADREGTPSGEGTADHEAPQGSTATRQAKGKAKAEETRTAGS